MVILVLRYICFVVVNLLIAWVALFVVCLFVLCWLFACDVWFPLLCFWYNAFRFACVLLFEVGVGVCFGFGHLWYDLVFPGGVGWRFVCFVGCVGFAFA